MSAIVAGVCRQCGKQFWVSIGHPAWFKAYLKTRQPTEEVRRFARLQEKRICPDCAPSDYAPFQVGDPKDETRRQGQIHR